MKRVKLKKKTETQPMTLDALLQFLRREIRMSHIYQPLLIRTLLDNGGHCTRRQLALALLMQDESQIEYYEKRLRDMPLPVLKRRGVISESGGIVPLITFKLCALSAMEARITRTTPIFAKPSFYT